MAAFHALRVAAIDRLCADAVAVTFSVPPALAADFSFRPGQSLTVRRPSGVSPSGVSSSGVSSSADSASGVLLSGDERRTYSICSAAGDAPRIGVREVPGGVISSWIVHELRPGDLVEVAPPSGTFTPDLAAGGRHVLIAAGSGITPVLSIAASLLRDPRTEVVLLYGNRRTDTVMFAEELADLKDAYPDRLQVVHVLSRESREVELFTGRLDGPRLRKLLPLLVDVSAIDHWWLCGPFAMVTDATTTLGESGVEPSRIHRELFWVDEAPPTLVRAESAPEGPRSEVTVVLDGRSTTIDVAEGVALLDGAQLSRPDLPFACKGGVCGTCRSRVVDGEVEMRRNFALEPAEVEAGFVLTCQARALSPKVVLDFDQ